MESLFKMLDINLNNFFGYIQIGAAAFVMSFVFNFIKDIIGIS